MGEDIELYHFGDFTCSTGIIINDILNIKKKDIFMLGGYYFNDILFYLNDNNYENIYNLDNLKIDVLKFGTPCIHHSIYNFYFNHDYKIENDKIINYEIVKNRFDIKIKNLREMLQNENMSIFFTFTNSSTSRANELKINDMLNYLNNKKNKFHLMIFTNDDFKMDNIPNLSIINLEHSLDFWYKMPLQKQIFLYKEIYNKFINALKLNNIVHSFPENFEETYYFKSNIDMILLSTSYFLENFDKFIALNPFEIIQNFLIKTPDQWEELYKKFVLNINK